MKKNRFFAGAFALAMTAVTVISPMSLASVTAAEVTDKPNFDFKVTGNYTEKKISEADMTAIANAFHYDQAATTVYVCGADAKGYIDWSNSAIDSWKVYATEVFQPVLSRDADGNLTVATDENGEVQRKWSTCAFYGTKTTDAIGHRMEDAKGIEDRYFPDNSGGGGGSNSKPFNSHTYYMTNEELNQNTFYDYENVDYTDWYVYGRLGSGVDYVLSENHFCLSAECDKHIPTINNHLGLTELTTWKAVSAEKQEETKNFYASEETQITGAYVIRVWYTADDIAINWVRRSEYEFFEMQWGLDKVSDVYGNVYELYGEIYEGGFYDLPITTEDRNFRYADFWILPEGVDTVLTLEDSLGDDTNVPGNENTPGDSNDNASNDGSNDSNTPNDTTTEPHVVDFSNAESQTVSREDFAVILEANREQDVVIKSNNGVTFTFAKGTMAQVDGKESYDFSTSINNTYEESMPSYLQRNSFVSQINFHYSGQLPAMASIRFYVGTEYAGQTLYYSLMNENNTFSVVNAYVVDAEGYLTVQQNHCSSYVVTTAAPVQSDDNGNNSNNNVNSTTSTNESNGNTNVTGTVENTTSSADNTTTIISPKTGDVNVVLPAVAMLMVGFGVVVVSRKRQKNV